MKISTPVPATRLRGANLNLVPILRALLREESVTRAAAQLGLSPSAVSCALADLRGIFGDPLLVRTGQRMTRTRRADQLLDKIETACAALEALLSEEAFDPAMLRRDFVIAAPDHLALLLAAPLAMRLGQTAPGVGLHFTDIGHGIDAAMAAGTVDLCLADCRTFAWNGRTSAPGCHDHLVGLAAADHPLAGRALGDMADLAGFPAAVWDPGPDLTMRASRPLMERFDLIDARIKLPGLNALPLIVLESDLIAIVPGVLARWMKRHLALASFVLPGDPILIDTGLHWSKLNDGTAADEWFRAIVAEELVRCHL